MLQFIVQGNKLAITQILASLDLSKLHGIVLVKMCEFQLIIFVL